MLSHDVLWLLKFQVSRFYFDAHSSESSSLYSSMVFLSSFLIQSSSIVLKGTVHPKQSSCSSHLWFCSSDQEIFSFTKTGSCLWTRAKQ